MAGFIDVLLRGLAFVCTSLALGGIAWLRFVLQMKAGVKPDAAARQALRVVAVSAALAAMTQIAVMLVALGASHAMFNLKQEFLTEVTHAPLGLFGAFAGYGRWLELRLPESRGTFGWLSTGCLTTVG